MSDTVDSQQAPVIYPRVPSFGGLDTVAAQCKLAREGKVKVPGGSESGPFIADFSFIHEIADDADAQIADSWIPGAVRMRAASMGEKGDGNRQGVWKPKEWDGHATIQRGDDVIYDGPLTVKAAVLRCSEKACVLTVSVRLHCIDGDDMRALTEAGINQLVHYKLVRSQLAGGEGDASDTPLFGGAKNDAPNADEPTGGDNTTPPDELRIGDIAIGVVGDDEHVGLVAVINDHDVILHLNIDGTEPVTVPHDQIVASHHLVGNRGGPSFAALRKIRSSAGRNVTARELLKALEPQPLGDDNTWKIDNKVTDRVLGNVIDDGSDLPAEA